MSRTLFFFHARAVSDHYINYSHAMNIEELQEYKTVNNSDQGPQKEKSYFCLIEFEESIRKAKFRCVAILIRATINFT